MNIVTTTSVFPMGTDLFPIVDRLAAIGFSTLDMAFDYCDCDGSPFMSQDYKDWAYRLRDHAQALNVRFSHSHGSFDAPDRGMTVERNFQCAQILGISYIVVHPAFRAPSGRIYEDPEEFLDINTKAYAPLLDLAKEYQVSVLSENLLWGASIPLSVQSELVSRLDSPWFGWCFDTGHANRCGVSLNSLIGLKKPPVSLHIHDNHGLHDEHLLPGDGSIRWKEFLDTLHATGYPGDLVLEAHHQSIEAPDEKRDGILTELLLRAGKMLAYYSRLCVKQGALL